MIHRFKSWVAENRAKQKKQTKEGYPEPAPDLPFFLNAEKQLLPICPASINAHDAPIFNKLSTEIRREIVIKAFGARRVHMDLFYGHPYISKPGDNGFPQGAHYEGNYDKSVPKRWQWRGCVCHRTMSLEVQKLADGGWRDWPTVGESCDSLQLGEQRNRRWDSDEPGDDTCFSGFAKQCGSYTYYGDDSACWIGATGWLLTCRQAYTEGVEVLYGTNTIHISSETLLTRLPCDIPTPPRLLLLQSLEIVWNLDTVKLSRGWALQRPIRHELRQDQLKQIIEIILDSLANVRRLHLALVLRGTYGVDLYLDNSFQLIDVLADQLCRWGRLKVPLQVSITSSVYKQLYVQAKEVAINNDVKPCAVFQFWRFLDGRVALAPGSPERFCKIDGSTVKNGYWIVHGDKDDDKRQIPECGFGLSEDYYRLIHARDLRSL